jgi:hypothetical protein
MRWLQWGRSISAAEIAVEGHRKNLMDDASMGPQHLSCGNKILDYRIY